MYATYQFLNSIRDNRLSSLSNEDIAKEFQERFKSGKDVDRHIAEIFCKNFGAWNKIYQLYSGTVPEDDGSSYVLESLTSSLKSWDSESGVSFITYAHRCLNLKFKWVCQYWYPFKGRNAKNDSIDQMVEDLGGDCFGADETSYAGVDVLAGVSNILTEDEKKVAKLIMSSPKINKVEVAEISGFTSYMVDKIYSSLKTKLAGAF